MTDEILSVKELEYNIASWNMIPTDGGKFEVIINGETLYSKLETGRHAEPGEVKQLLTAKLAKMGAQVQPPQ